MLLPEPGELCLEAGVLQLAAVQLALGALVVHCERLVLPEQLAIRRVQPAEGKNRKRVAFICSTTIIFWVNQKQGLKTHIFLGCSWCLMSFLLFSMLCKISKLAKNTKCFVF